MPALTRRRSDNDHQETWHVYYGDVRVGSIGERAGVPKDLDQWGWSVGFFPRSHRDRAAESGTAASFREARGDFERAWERYLPGCTPQDFVEYRRQRDWTAWKHRMHDDGLPLPTQNASGRARCFCGAEIAIGTTDAHVLECHMAPVPEDGP